jgi:hypothetical protein
MQDSKKQRTINENPNSYEGPARPPQLGMFPPDPAPIAAHDYSHHYYFLDAWSYAIAVSLCWHPWPTRDNWRGVGGKQEN